MNSIENAIKTALLSFPATKVSRGPAPLDAPAGSVYYSIEKFSYGDEIYSASVRIRYFPYEIPSTRDGEDIFGFVGSINIGSAEFDAEKYECRIYGRYVEVTVEYTFDSGTFEDAVTDGFIESHPESADGDEEIFPDGVMMKTIAIGIAMEAEL